MDIQNNPVPLDELYSQCYSDRPCERAVTRGSLKVIEKFSVSGCCRIYRAILAYSLISGKADVITVFLKLCSREVSPRTGRQPCRSFNILTC